MSRLHNLSDIRASEVWSYNIPRILGMDPYAQHDHTTGRVSTSYKHFPSSEQQDHIMNLLVDLYNERYSTVTIIDKKPQSKCHQYAPFLQGYVNAVATIGPEHTIRPIRINSRTRYKYNDAFDNNISSHQLIEMYVCMECFDVPCIDYVKYRGDKIISISTVQRNTPWFNKHLPIIKSFYDKS